MTRLSARAALVLALPLFALAAVAQPAPRRPTPDLAARITALSSSLSLTADQQARLAAVGSRYAGQTDPAAAWQAAADVQAVLTEAQTAVLAAPRGDGARAGRGGRRGARAGAMRRGGAGRTVRAEFAPRAEALRSRLRAGEIDAADFAEQSRMLRAEAGQRLDATRTPEQRQHAAGARVRRDAATAARIRALGLTPQQQSALRVIAGERVRLAPERGADRPDRAARRARAEATRADREALRARAGAVLTQQQKAIARIHGVLVRPDGGRRGAGGRR